MNSFNVLNTENKVQSIWIRICTFSRLYILHFVEQNGLSFDGLTHAATPFGGNLLASKWVDRKTN